MANRFTKSVLERQAKELKAHATEQAASAEPPAPAAEQQPAIQEAPPRQKAPAKQKVSAPTPASPPKAAPARQPTAAPIPMDLTAFIVRDEGRNAKNKTFYLDAAVIDGIRAAAAAQNVTDSKLVNDILKKILGV